MSDLDSLPGTPLPEAGNDPGDPNQPEEQLDAITAPLADPTNDMDHDLSDDLSELSDVDEAQFAEFDPANIAIEDRPQIAIDEDNVGQIGRHKRKREEGADGEVTKKKKKEGRREKKKRRQDIDDDFSGGEELSGKRARRRKPAEDGEQPKPRARREETPDEELDPETRRRRALDRAMDAALKNPNRSRRRRRDGIDVSSALDDEAEKLRARMAEAAEKDNEARTENPPRPAMHKLKLLPEVVEFLGRNGRDVENAIVDPESNLLQGVRFFLEPLGDGSLPAYNIQRDLFGAIARLPINKDVLISSGLGKVILFYTKSKKLELGIKRQAERLLAEWTRPILKRSDNYRNRMLETRQYDPTRQPKRSSTSRMIETPEQRRARELAPPTKSNRARIDTTMKSYSIVPSVSLPANVGQFARPQGAGGAEAFRKIKARHAAEQRAKFGPKMKHKDT